jgi:tRNA nucleotidyltransferase (CCA-adding enzyme)
MKTPIPDHVTSIVQTLTEAGHKAYIVGGSVRDVLIGLTPKDWDVTTDALPDKIQELFPDSAYENDFGTVAVKVRFDNHVEIVEVTTFRTEGDYQDSRHPGSVEFVTEVTEDLARRDFTINAMAMDLEGNIVDPFDGQKDLETKIIRTVGTPEDRFGEDALRLMRAVRFAMQLDFTIETNTLEAMKKLTPTLENIAKERINIELTKMMMTPRAMQGFILLQEVGLLTYIMPELQEGIGCTQNKHHIYDVWEHLLRTMQHAVNEDMSFDLRMAGLLHDIAKPRTKEGEGIDSTFHNHEIVGASMAYEILLRLKYPRKFAARISKLVRYHMFYYDIGAVTDSSVRRLIMKAGKENIADLIKLRECDRIGSGTPKARPYRLRHFEYLTDKVMSDPISIAMLAIKGQDLMTENGLTPGPKIGAILDVLLSEVLEDPSRNTRKNLLNRAKELESEELSALRDQAREIIEFKQEEMETRRKRKYHVK